MQEQVVVLPLGVGPTLFLVDSATAGSAAATVWPGMGATARSIVWFRLEPGSSTLELRHSGEAVYFVRAGSGAVAGADGPGGSLSPRQEISAGSVVHVAPGSPYRFHAGAGTDGLDFIGGPCPPDRSWFPGSGCDGHGTDATDPADAGLAPEAAGDDGATIDVDAAGARGIQVLSSEEPALMLPLISSDARMIAWPGNGAWDATMNYVRMERGEENTEHAHAHSEDTIVILEGRGSVDDLTAGQTLEFQAGDVIHVPARVRHAVRANRGSPVVSVGGPCPADVVFLRRCGADIPDRRPATAASHRETTHTA
jgi:quercetin dioxygenase-like cupin family protein